MISLVIYVAFLLIATGWLIAVVPTRIPRIWSGEVKFSHASPRWWSWGQATWRGFVRAVPIGATMGWGGLVVAAWCLLLLSSIQGTAFIGNGLARAVLEVVFVAGASIAVLAFATSLAILLFNQPKWVVPPSLRNESGALRTWLNRRGAT